MATTKMIDSLSLNFPLSLKLQTYSQYWCGEKKKKKSPERAIKEEIIKLTVMRP